MTSLPVKRSMYLLGWYPPGSIVARRQEKVPVSSALHDLHHTGPLCNDPGWYAFIQPDTSVGAGLWRGRQLSPTAAATCSCLVDLDLPGALGRASLSLDRGERAC